MTKTSNVAIDLLANVFDAAKAQGKAVFNVSAAIVAAGGDKMEVAIAYKSGRLVNALALTGVGARAKAEAILKAAPWKEGAGDLTKDGRPVRSALEQQKVRAADSAWSNALRVAGIKSDARGKARKPRKAAKAAKAAEAAELPKGLQVAIPPVATPDDCRAYALRELSNLRRALSSMAKKLDQDTRHALEGAIASLAKIEPAKA